MKDNNKKLKRKDRDLFELCPGYSCNAACQFCSIDPKKRNIEKNTEDLLEIIYQANEEGFKYLGIGGGEPTIRKDLPKLIKFANRLDFEIIRIETNGITLSYKDYCKKLIEAGLDFVKLSIHGHNSEIHDKLTQVPGSFNYVMEAIENLHELGIRVEINTVINKLNYRYYNEFIKQFAFKGVGSFIFIYPLYTGKMKKEAGEVGVSMSEIAPYMGKALNLIDDLELDKGLVMNVPPCFLPNHTDKLVEFESFNTKVRSPEKTVESIDWDRKNEKIKVSGCNNCTYFEKCEGVWRSYFDIFSKKEVKAIK